MVGELALLAGVVGAIATSALREPAELKHLHRQLLAVYAHDGPAFARALLERSLPPFQHIVPSKAPKQRARMAALAVLGDADALELELVAHRGSAPTLFAVNSIALIAIAVRTTGELRARAIARLDMLGGQVDRLNQLYWRAKRELHALVALGHAQAGTAIEPADLAELSRLATRGLVGLLITYALIAGYDASGQPAQAETCRRRVRAATTAFESPTPR